MMCAELKEAVTRIEALEKQIKKLDNCKLYGNSAHAIIIDDALTSEEKLKKEFDDAIEKNGTNLLKEMNECLDIVLQTLKNKREKSQEEQPSIKCVKIGDKINRGQDQFVFVNLNKNYYFNFEGCQIWLTWNHFEEYFECDEDDEFKETYKLEQFKEAYNKTFNINDK